MLRQHRPWQEALAIVDGVMKNVSDITDPEEMVRAYWNGISELLPSSDFLALSRRGVDPPEFLITRSARFSEHFNPWTQRERLPRLAGGLLGEIAYANQPVVIEDLPERLRADDSGHFYLQGYQALVALPNYENGQGLNVGISLFESGEAFDPSIVPLMHWQASLFGRGTQNLVLRNQLQGALRNLDRELQIVGQIQRALLPERLPDIPGFELSASYETSARAGGDYYDFFPLGGDDWGIFIADVSGHGTPAAVLMAITHALAHTRPGTPRPARLVVEDLNRHLCRWYTSSGAFVTAFYATLSPATRKLTYSIAGHELPRLLRGGRAAGLEDCGGGLPLGINSEESYGECTITLQKGDLLMLYTDGITEAMAPAAPDGTRALFGVARLDHALQRCETPGAAGRIEGVRAAVAEFTQGTPATDDRTLVALRCLP